MKQIFLFCLLFLPLAANEWVDVISGAYVEERVDLFLKGPYPIALSCKFSRPFGWIFNPMLFNENDYEQTEHKALCRDNEKKLLEITTKKEQNLFRRLAFIHDENKVQALADDGRQVLYEFLPPEIIQGGYAFYLTRIITPDGQEVLYEYCKHPKKRLKLIKKRVASDGSYLEFSYDEKGRVISLYDGKKEGVIRFLYKEGQTIVTDPQQRQTIYTFDEQKNIQAIEIEGVRKELFFRNPNGTLRSKAMVDIDGNYLNCKVFSYDENGLCIKKALYGNLSGHCSSPLLLNDSGLPVENGIEASIYYLQYDCFGKLITETEKNGSSKRYRYDAKTGDLLATYIEVGRKIVKRTFVWYDHLGLPTSVIEDDGAAEDADDLSCMTERKIIRYEPIREGALQGLVKQKKVLAYEEGALLLSERVEFSYDAQGNICFEAHYDRENVLHYTIKNSYDNFGRLLYMNDSRGFFRQTSYDAAGRLIFEATEEGSKSFVYDEKGRLIKKERTEREAPKEVEQFVYGPAGMIIATLDTLENRQTYRYDVMGRLAAVIYPPILGNDEVALEPEEQFLYDSFDRKIAHIDGMGYLTETEYNAEGKPSKILYSDGTKELFVYSVHGDLVTHTNRLGNTTYYRYTPLHQIAEERSEDSRILYKYRGFKLIEIKTEEQSVFLSYNPYGQLKKKVSDGKIEIYHYDSRGHLASSQEEDAITNYHYDSKEHLSCISINGQQNAISPSSSKISYGTTVNDLGQTVRTAKKFHPFGAAQLTIFNALGNIETIEERSKEGSLISRAVFRYDAAGGRTKEIYWQNDFCNHTIHRSFGPMGRIETLEEEGSFYHYLYDARSLLQGVIKPDQTHISMSYDAKGRITSYASDDGRLHYTYQYDKQGRATAAFDHVNGCDIFRLYDSMGNLIEEQFFGNLAISYQYDRLGRKTRMTLPDGSNTDFIYCNSKLASIERGGKVCTFDNGQIKLQNAWISIEEKERSLSINSPHFQQSRSVFDQELLVSTNALECQVRLDNMGQIIQDAEHHFFYDGLGNRVGEDIVVDKKNRRLRCKEELLSYDEMGNLSSSGKSRLFYDPLDRLSTSFNGMESTNYFYDPFGRRIIKESKGEKTIFLYDGDLEIGSCDENGTMKEMRILAEGRGGDIGAACWIEINGQVFFPIQDVQGSIRQLLDPNTTEIVADYQYSSFGECEALVETISSPWRFLSKRIDPETGHLFFGRRCYDPVNGRFTTPDPLGVPDGPNRYLFAQNNPYLFNDPHGLSTLPNSFTHAFYHVAEKWNGIYRDMRQLYDFTISHYSYFHYMNDDIEYLGGEIFGKSFFILTGYYVDSPVADIYGEGEMSERARITMINGILVTHPYCIDTVDFFSKTHGKNNIHYIFRPTQGWTWDMITCGLIKMGYLSPQAKELAATWRRLINEMGGIDEGGHVLHYAHSLGGADTYAAKSLLSQGEQKMIKVVTFGSARLIPNNGFQDVQNYISFRDGVPLLDPFNYVRGMLRHEDNIHFIGSYLGFPFIDHLLSGETYKELIERLGKAFINEYLSENVL